MDSPNPDALDERALAETPEDVAVLYSWANLQGAKYRDFSASRREYRAQMRHRQAEQQREEEMRAAAEAEAAAAEAERAAREAEGAARFHATEARRASAEHFGDHFREEEDAHASAIRQAEDLNRLAASERVEAARRAEGAAVAEASARREAREMAEAQASAARQAARYRESEFRRQSLAGPQPATSVPGEISDPYTNDEPVILPGRLFHQPHVPEDDMQPTRLSPSREGRFLIPQPDPLDPKHMHDIKEYWVTGTVEQEARIAAGGQAAIEKAASRPQDHVSFYDPNSRERGEAVQKYAENKPYLDSEHSRRQHNDLHPHTDAPSSRHRAGVFEQQPRSRSIYDLSGAVPIKDDGNTVHKTSVETGAPMYDPIPGSPRPELLAAKRGDSASHSASRQGLPSRKVRGFRPDAASGVHSIYDGHPSILAEQPAESSVPAWITSSDSVRSGRVSRLEPPRHVEPQRTFDPKQTSGEPPNPVLLQTSASPQSPVMNTLQHSRERVASRWFALKGVFDHQEQQPEPASAQHKDVRVPMLTVFSLAGGVGKTSLVATLGRALSFAGEKVLLADTTSHGLLPFYFGASELRPGVVRTFSPPAGSSDAAIALVSYDVARSQADAAQQEWFNNELTAKATAMQRVIVDISLVSPWVVKRLAKMGSVVVVPVAPDMNSVISLGPVEKVFSGIVDAEGRPVQPYYLLNQFDASLPLHLDVREVMRQQLGDRLLPFVIRRSSVVSEALAEGMTVIDYAPDSPVSGDYMNFANWLRMLSAAASSGMKNARWSER